MAMEKTDKSKYYIFIDECGNHNLAQAEIIMPGISKLSWNDGAKKKITSFSTITMDCATVTQNRWQPTD